MIGQLLGPVSQLAGTWLNGKVEEKAAQNKVKVAKAEAEAQIMLSAATSEAEWEKIMAQGTQNSWKDEYLVLLFSIQGLMREPVSPINISKSFLMHLITSQEQYR